MKLYLIYSYFEFNSPLLIFQAFNMICRLLINEGCLLIETFIFISMLHFRGFLLSKHYKIAFKLDFNSFTCLYFMTSLRMRMYDIK